MEVRVLGPLEVTGSEGDSIAIPGSKMRGLVAMLALEPGRVVLPERISDALWGDDGGRRTLNTLQQVVSKLRRVLTEAGEPDRIVTRPSGYLLDIDADAVDAGRFEGLVVRARDQMSHDPVSASQTLADALALWRGPALADAPGSEVIASVRSRLDELHAVAMEDRVDAELARGHHQRMVPELEVLVAQGPLRERRWGQLMLALYGSGRQAEALRAFQRARDTLADQLGIEPGPELRRIEAAVLAQDPTLAAPVAAQASSTPVGSGLRRRGNVRHPISACIGRDGDMKRLLDLSHRYRLVTLTGPGGVGKTRLAVELGVALTDRVPDGVWWVDLSPALDAADIASSIQSSLGLEPSGAAGRPAAATLDSTVAALADRTVVLVLDNCEHIVDLLAPIAEELLGACARLHMVATSREGLGVAGELLFVVRPLAMAAAVELFEERIEAVGADVRDPRAAVTVQQICERLDRLPLALELAAARARHLRLDEILTRLDRHVDALGDGPRTASARQRNLRAVADWSYELLDESERLVFERLSVFRAGATLVAAMHVCAGDELAASTVENALARLTDKSLVVAEDAPGGTRYRMLQTLADFARERLEARGGLDETRRRHALWVRDLAGTVQYGARTTGAIVAAVQDEDVAIRQAIDWALGTDPVLAVEICTRLVLFWTGTWRVSVGWELLSASLDAVRDRDPATRSFALSWGAFFSAMAHDMETSDRLADEALEFAQALGDPRSLGLSCLARSSAVTLQRRDLGEALRCLDEAAAHFRDARDEVGLGLVSLQSGDIRLLLGQPDAAQHDFAHAIATFRAGEQYLGLIAAVNWQGEYAWRRGDDELYGAMFRELLELGRQGRSAGVTAVAAARLTIGHLASGDLEAAREAAEEALASTSESFMPATNGFALRANGLVDLRSDRIEDGRTSLREAIESFLRGSGGLGLGRAAECWLDLSRSYTMPGERAEAEDAARRAVELAVRAGDPWILRHAEEHLARLAT